MNRAGRAAARCLVCVADLEDELIRSLGVRRVQELIEAEGRARGPSRPSPRSPPSETDHRQQMRRFMETAIRRKIRYGHVPPRS